MSYIQNKYHHNNQIILGSSMDVLDVVGEADIKDVSKPVFDLKDKLPCVSPCGLDN